MTYLSITHHRLTLHHNPVRHESSLNAFLFNPEHVLFFFFPPPTDDSFFLPEEQIVCKQLEIQMTGK